MNYLPMLGVFRSYDNVAIIGVLFMIITKRGPDLCPEDIIKFEQEIGYPVPEDYRSFLLKYNGAKVKPRYFNVPGWKYQQSLVNEFDYIIFDDSGYGIRQVLAISGYRYPEAFIPIGSDPGGNTILLALKAPYRGQVYFWDHEHQPEDRLDRLEDYNNVFFLSSSFNEFLNSLKDENEI